MGRTSLISRWRSLTKGLCPRCKKGDLFDGWIRVRPNCASCGLLFEREEGYFLGAMYMEYALAAVFLGIVSSLLMAIWAFTLYKALGISLVLFCPFIPAVIRFSRTLWIYFDNTVDPQ